MSAYRKLVTQGYVGYEPLGDWYVFPNFGPVYKTERAARREVGPDGKVFAVEISYTEVPA